MLYIKVLNIGADKAVYYYVLAFKVSLKYIDKA